MQVDFDKLRKRIGNCYNELYLLRNEITEKETRDSYNMILETLHDYVATLLCCESDNENIKSVDFVLLPQDEDEED